MRRNRATALDEQRPVNRGGLTFVFRMQEETGASPVEAVRAYNVVREAFRLEDY